MCVWDVRGKDGDTAVLEKTLANVGQNQSTIGISVFTALIPLKSPNARILKVGGEISFLMNNPEEVGPKTKM